MSNQDEQYIDDLMKVNQEVKELKAKDEKQKDLLDEALFLISTHIKLYKKPNDISQEVIDKIIIGCSMKFLCKLYGKKEAPEESEKKEFIEFITKKQSSYMQKHIKETFGIEMPQ